MTTLLVLLPCHSMEIYLYDKIKLLLPNFLERRMSLCPRTGDVQGLMLNFLVSSLHLAAAGIYAL